MRIQAVQLTGNTNQFKLHGIKNSLAATHGKDIFMMKAKVLQAFRKTNNTIYGYRIQDEYGRIKDVGPVTLKKRNKRWTTTVRWL